MKIAECGFVYMITSPSGRVYVGSTIDVDRRVYSYSSLNCKEQVKIYNSIKKYGWGNHVFEVVWAGLREEMMKYETLIGWGFDVLEDCNLNLSLPKLGCIWNCRSNEYIINIGNASRGRRHTIESKDKIRNKLMGITRTQIHKNIISKRNIERNSILHAIHARKKIVLQYELSGVFVKEWESATCAGRELRISGNNISACCIGKQKSAYGFVWEYKKK